MVVFYVIGALTAVWAVVLAAIGIKRHDFPATPGAMRAVMAISAVLVLASIGSGIITGALEGDDEEEAEAAEETEAEEAGVAEDVEETEAVEAEAGGEEIELSAVPSGEFAFEEAELEAAAGSVTLAMANPSPVAHNVSVEGDGVDEEGETVGEGETSTVSAELDPGEYTFYCSVPGHQEGGMEGTLTVE